MNSYGSASTLPGSAELLNPAQLCISTSVCKKFPLLGSLPAPWYDFSAECLSFAN
ncbi:MAG: hypothetical protein GQF41_3854 [Candidatus Rifleibacterium amylolyticum]|nr:MAG: hypothetical protein GQF41_3854 [Candidatus Rifleibacterium amylolyticum]